MEMYQKQTMTASWPYTIYFGDDTSIPIAPNGDIVDGIVLHISLPQFTNLLATDFISIAELRYGGDLIERLYGQTIFMLSDIYVSSARQPGLAQLIGPGVSDFRLELPFHFKIPYCALRGPVTLRIIWNDFPGYTDALDVKTEITYVLLSDSERNDLMSKDLVYTTRDFQRLQFTIDPGVSYVRVATEFDNCVKELYWIIGNYLDDLVSLRLSLNGTVCIDPLVGTNNYLRNIQPLEYHTRIPVSNIYMYSFALDPESPHPTGEIDFTQVYTQIHELYVNPSDASRILTIYAHSLNRATIQNGKLTMLRTALGSGYKL